MISWGCLGDGRRALEVLEQYQHAWAVATRATQSMCASTGHFGLGMSIAEEIIAIDAQDPEILATLARDAPCHEWEKLWHLSALNLLTYWMRWTLWMYLGMCSRLWLPHQAMLPLKQVRHLSYHKRVGTGDRHLSVSTESRTKVTSQAKTVISRTEA